MSTRFNAGDRQAHQNTGDASSCCFSYPLLRGCSLVSVFTIDGPQKLPLVVTGGTVVSEETSGLTYINFGGFARSLSKEECLTGDLRVFSGRQVLVVGNAISDACVIKGGRDFMRSSSQRMQAEATSAAFRKSRYLLSGSRNRGSGRFGSVHCQPKSFNDVPFQGDVDCEAGYQNSGTDVDPYFGIAGFECVLFEIGTESIGNRRKIE